MNGTHQATASPAYVGAAVVARIGRTPTTPSAPSPIAPTASPPPARASGGTPLRVSADMTKYVAAPTIAASAHSTPSSARSAPDRRSSTRTRPTAARPAPASVSGRGRSPRRSHSHATMAAGAVYSISSAGATSIAATAEKYANCVPATGTAP